MSLTDDWKAGKLKQEWYWIKNKVRGIVPDQVIGNNWLISGRYNVEEVLSPCDYDHFVELTEKVKELEKDIQTITNSYKRLEKEQASDIAHGQALVEEFGDFEALYEELQRLRKIAVKYDCIKINGNYPDKISRLKSRIKHFLELQANQDKELEQLREDLDNYKILAETRGKRLIDSERKNNDIVKVLTSCDYDELQRLKKGWELYSHETVITKQLRQLLRECKTFFEEENPKDFTVLSERMEDLLTKINEVLNENIQQ